MSAETGGTQVQGVFINLPVADLSASITFFEALGFAFNPQFTDHSAACLVLGPSHHAMLLGHTRFKEFIPHERVDAHCQTEVLVALQLDSREAVDTLMQKALAAGGTLFRPVEDHGWMYGHAFQDLDGHIWEPFFMDMAAMQAAHSGAAT